jgi:hypothetical protein
MITTKKDKQIIEQIITFSHVSKDNANPQLSLHEREFKMAWEYFREYEERELPMPNEFKVERLTVKLWG